MPVGLAAALFIAVITITLILVTNPKRPKKLRVIVGVVGGLLCLLVAGYCILALILIGAID